MRERAPAAAAARNCPSRQVTTTTTTKTLTTTVRQTAPQCTRSSSDVERTHEDTHTKAYNCAKLRYAEPLNKTTIDPDLLAMRLRVQPLAKDNSLQLKPIMLSNTGPGRTRASEPSRAYTRANRKAKRTVQPEPRRHARTHAQHLGMFALFLRCVVCPISFLDVIRLAQ